MKESKETNHAAWLHEERQAMANRLRKIRVKIWTEIYDNRTILEQSEFLTMDEACLAISTIISDLSEGEVENEESE